MVLIYSTTLLKSKQAMVLNCKTIFQRASKQAMVLNCKTIFQRASKQAMVLNCKTIFQASKQEKVYLRKQAKLKSLVLSKHTGQRYSVRAQWC